MSDPAADLETTVPFTVRMAKVFADPLRIKILEELNRQDMSLSQFYDRFGGGSATKIYRHFKVLEKYGWLVKTEEKTGGERRGATEHFYRATGFAVFDNTSWATLPMPLKEVFTWKTFEHYAQRVNEAMEAGTIDARSDRHFTWTPASLDQAGWKTLLPGLTRFST